jgi:hypothetical protein
MLRVKACPGSPTVFFSESSELECVRPECGKLYKRVPPELVYFSLRQRSFLRAMGLWDRVDRRLKDLEGYASKFRVGDLCKKCGVGTLDVRFHTVDIAAYGLNGGCGCEYFLFSLRKELEGAGRDERLAGAHRCQHIDAARDFALDLSLRAHEHERLVLARGREDNE